MGANGGAGEMEMTGFSVLEESDVGGNNDDVGGKTPPGGDGGGAPASGREAAGEAEKDEDVHGVAGYKPPTVPAAPEEAAIANV